MPKGYVISRVDITNPEAYARYAAAATKAIADHGGKPLARGGRSEALEGKARARNVVLEFDSYEAARRYFHSEQYQAARALREGAAEMEMVLVEGVLTMPKGYWIARVDVHDPEIYQQYVKANAVGVRQIRGAASWSAAASMSSPRARRRRATSSSSFATTRPRSPATIRLNTARPRNCATPRRRGTSSSPKVTTARSQAEL